MIMGKQPGFVLAVRRPADLADVHAEMQKLIALVQCNADAVLITDTQGLIVHVNAAFEIMTGYRRDEMVGQTPRILKSGLQSPDFYASMWMRLCSGDEFRGLFINRKKSGETFHAEQTIRPFVDRFGHITHYVATAKDISARVRMSQHPESLANHDSLTGLPDRNLFLDRLQREVARARRTQLGFALLCLVVDHFKAVKDHFGHAAGDELLHTLAGCLTHCVREEDTVARLGDDEFALILVDSARRAGVRSVLDKILRSVGDAALRDDASASSPVSIGVAVFPEDGHDENTLLKAAETAMNRAKAVHGNCYRFASLEPPSSPSL